MIRSDIYDSMALAAGVMVISKMVIAIWSNGTAVFPAGWNKNIGRFMLTFRPDYVRVKMG